MKRCDCETGRRVGVHEPDCASQPNPHNPFQSRGFVDALFAAGRERHLKWEAEVDEAYRMNEIHTFSLTVSP